MTMRNVAIVTAGLLVMAGATSLNGARQTPSTPAGADQAAQAAVVQKYCGSCHSRARHSGNVVLEQIDLGDVASSAETLEKMVRKLRSGTMPPPGAPRPDPASYEKLRTSIETSLDRAAAAHPNPGRRPAVHRLNRAEYANAIRDLLGFEIDASALLPPDDSGFGFDNIADVLSVSPMLTERYLSAAQKISRVAVGDPAIRPTTESFAVNKYLRQDGRTSEDLPFGSRGGLAVRYYFPVEGDYIVKIFLDRTYDGRVRGLGEQHLLDVRVDGEKVQQLTIGGASPEGGRGRGNSRAPAGDGAEVTIHVKPGTRTIGVSFLRKANEAEGMLRPRYAVTSYEYAGDAVLPPGIGRIELRGPYEVKGTSTSPSRDRIFVCHPPENSSASAETRCATQILSTLSRRAFRRPVADADVKPLVQFYQSARQAGSFDAAIEAALRRVLVSPDFLFRIEHDPSNNAAVYRISDLELASRLSFFLWSSIPDDELIDVAAQGRLKTPAVLDQQVRRMLADRRSTSLVENFASQWLYLRNLRLHSPDPMGFPDFDENLRLAFEQEIKLFLDSQLREDHPLPELLTANYTFVNERLAAHYGIPNVYGEHFRRVELTDDARKGLLGKGAILMVTSYPNRTSPVLRGKWLLENILGAPPAPPPPNVPAFPENVAGTPPKSVRERMERHRADPVCASCHRVMDPLGFALENFDGIGRWRDTSEAGTRIDASGTLMDGTAVDGPATLRNALVAHRQEFVGTVTEKLLTYALGRGVEYYDQPAVRKIVQNAAEQQYRWSAIIRGIAESVPFQMRSREVPGATQ